MDKYIVQCSHANKATKMIQYWYTYQHGRILRISKEKRKPAACIIIALWKLINYDFSVYICALKKETVKKECLIPFGFGI